MIDVLIESYETPEPEDYISYNVPIGGDGREDMNIKITREGIIVDVVLEGEPVKCAWLTWSDVYDLTH